MIAELVIKMMRKELPHLIRLLDDESSVVRTALCRIFRAYGPELLPDLIALEPPLTPEQFDLVKQILADAELDAAATKAAERQQKKSTRKPRFRPGELVRHVRYGYRGVVVSYDPECMADERWYKSNLHQPERNQPWYHVLIDSAHQVTYAAETSLAEDETQEPIDHPLVPLFFRGFENGRHLRNKRPWPRSHL